MQQFSGFQSPHAAKGLDSFDAHELVAQNVVLSSGDFHELGHRGVFLRQANVVDHHGHNQRVSVRQYRGKNERGGLC